MNARFALSHHVIKSALIGLALSTSCALAGNVLLHASDPHLSAVTRTAGETARVKSTTANPLDFSKPEAFEGNPGGDATMQASVTADAFSQPSANLLPARQIDFKLGHVLFGKVWVAAPAATLATDGLGPLFNARSCQECHIKNGRGHPPLAGEKSVSLVFKVSVPVEANEPLSELEEYLTALDGDLERDRPHPVFGGQIQSNSVAGIPGERDVVITYEVASVTLPDGESVMLRRPTYSAHSLDKNVKVSPRLAPQIIGLGLIEAIPAADILAHEDPNDADGDGISGRANIVWSKEFNQPMLGRFGLKAGKPTILEQTAAAFVIDIGISSPLNPAASGDCTLAQTDCLTATHGISQTSPFEINAESLALVADYSRNLAVPARRNINNPDVLRGKELFYNAGCASCHTPKFVTQRLDGQPKHSFQLIWPFSDFLLHDMGDGLADNRPESRANGREWRTAPLWGIGLTGQVTGQAFFLHDGRARDLKEAILWHGGEAQKARDAFADLNKNDRNAIIRYLESL